MDILAKIYLEEYLLGVAAVYLYPTLALRISPPEVSVCNTEDEAVKDDSDDDWQDDGHPNFHMWPDPVTPFLVLKLK